MSHKILCGLTVRGNDGKPYDFDTIVNPQYLDYWREIGLDIDPIVNRVPLWAVGLGLLKPWCFFQDMFNFKNPFAFPKVTDHD